MEIVEFLTLLQIAVCLMIGLWCGGILMFYWNYREVKELEDLLNKKNMLLDDYANKYEDDGYEAY